MAFRPDPPEFTEELKRRLQELFAERLDAEGKVILKELLPDELERFFAVLGESKYRVRQLMRWLYINRRWDFEEMTDFSAKLRYRLKLLASVPCLKFADPRQSVQDTSKFLFLLPDGNMVESVKMRYLEHLGARRVAVCISSQVGCAMGCQFCASGKAGLVRNLRAWEIVDQALQIQKVLDEAEERVANIVFMGIGEPMHNLDNVVRAIKLLNSGDGFGVGMRHIAVSTCGVVPGIERLAELRYPLKLAISLHASNNEVRSEIMPVNRRWPIEALLQACRRYQEAVGRRITFEYVMLEGVNDSEEDAARLVRLLKGIRSLVNLIPWNAVDHPSFKRSSKERIRRFQEKVQELGIRCTLRREKGADIDAACGQLRLRRMAEESDDIAAYIDED
ncbi:23S rRNA (adenine(2503)-C(2))-methyltransferase RlmN [bacterium]|nr:23S rRNA (adenine(2503)-C(2))-methyltransferase RlmN [bacterium]